MVVAGAALVPEAEATVLEQHHVLARHAREPARDVAEQHSQLRPFRGVQPAGGEHVPARDNQDVPVRQRAEARNDQEVLGLEKYVTGAVGGDAEVVEEVVPARHLIAERADLLVRRACGFGRRIHHGCLDASQSQSAVTTPQ